AAEALDLTASQVPFALSGRRLLEIGSGVGAVQVVANRRGILANGVEPSLLGSRAGARLIQERGAPPPRIACGVGEQLCFRNDVFDIVCSFQVLEHTRTP